MVDQFPKHFIRYGRPIEQKTLQKHKSTFDGIVLNGNTLAYIPRALSLFVLVRNWQKNFFVDPITHAFQHPLIHISDSNGEIKSSIQKLIEIYGEFVGDAVLNKRPVSHSHFVAPVDKQKVQSFVSNVLTFQKDGLRESADPDFKEYFEDQAFTGILNCEPLLLIAPYFFMDAKNWQDWIPINKEMISISKQLGSDLANLAVFAEIVISKELLLEIKENENTLGEFLNSYKQADGFLLWIDEFDEHKADESIFQAFSSLVKSFRDAFPAKPIVNLYGGYFSQLLMKKGLTSVVHGPEYGESRSVVPVGGGIPIAKYYFPPLKRRIPSNEVVWLLRNLDINTKVKFSRKICACKICINEISGNNIEEVVKSFLKTFGSVHPIIIKGRSGTIVREYPDSETQEFCLAHYLEIKKSEFDEISKKPIEKLLGNILKTYSKYSDWLDDRDIAYLEYWKNAIENV